MDKNEIKGLITLKLRGNEGNIIRVQDPNLWIKEIIRDLKKLIREEVLYTEAFRKFDKERRNLIDTEGENYERLLRLSEEYEKKLTRVQEAQEDFIELEVWRITENAEKCLGRLIEIEEIDYVYNTYTGETGGDNE